MHSLICNAGGRWRLNGELSVSRSLGDLPYIQYGLVANPTVSDWIDMSPDTLNPAVGRQPRTRWLILASDGVFESMQPGEMCEAAHAFATGVPCQIRTR